MAALPLALAILLATWSSVEKHMEKSQMYMRWFLLTLTFTTILAVLLVLPPAGSRAAWIASITGLLYVVWCYPERLKARDIIRVWFGRLGSLQIMLLALFLLALIVAGGIGLYSLKKDSADGRVLIWKVTSGLICGKPITGYGSDAFQRHYMSSQADWFEQERGAPQQLIVAGSPQYPFNEFLHIWLKKGVVSVILILVFAQFSYPMGIWWLVIASLIVLGVIWLFNTSWLPVKRVRQIDLIRIPLKIVLVYVAIVLFRMLFFELIGVSHTSMQDTVKPRDMIYVSRLRYGPRLPSGVWVHPEIPLRFVRELFL